MQLCQLTLAVPGDSLANVPTSLDNQLAANLLATWTSLWHPTLLTQARSLPTAISADTLADEPPEPGQLVLVPGIVTNSACQTLVDQDNSLVSCVKQFASRGQVISHLAEKFSLDFSQADEFVADFYALGFAYLQLELLTQHMTYESDESKQRLTDAVLAAADAAVQRDSDRMTRHLTEAYDQLIQSRNHYYPIDFYLIDLSLTAPTTVGQEFADECSQAKHHNALVTGELLEYMAVNAPDSLAALRQAVEGERMTVCCGTNSNAPLESLPPEQLLQELLVGRRTAETHLGKLSRTFAHHCGPLSPILPSLLTKLGYQSVLLTDFSGRPMPDSYSTRTTWTGLDSCSIDALAASAIDMGSPQGMLAMPSLMQDAMNYDLAAALLLVGWPGHRSEFYNDIKQVALRCPLLGRPITLDEYFEITESQDYSATVSVDAYPSPLESSFQTDNHLAIEALACIAEVSDPIPQCFAELLGASDKEPTGRLVLNASSRSHLDRIGSLPAFGWQWTASRAAGELPNRCEPGVLRNEWMEVVFDSNTGGISATRPYETRGNFLSQQLVIAPLGPQGIAAGLQLAFDGWEVVESSENVGVLASKCRVVDRDGKSLANVLQETTLAANSRAIELRLSYELTTNRPPSCILASRIAVKEEDFSMTRFVAGVDLPTSRSQITTERLGIGAPKIPVAVACDHPRLHRRHSGRMLDTTLFKAAGENTVASLSYCLDCRYPAHLVSPQSARELILELNTSEPVQQSGWWLHLGARNLLATHLDAQQMEEGVVVRLRVVETAGRPVDTKLLAWQPIRAAHQTNFRGEADQLLKLDDNGAVRLSLAAYEFAEIEFTLDT